MRTTSWKECWKNGEYIFFCPASMYSHGPKVSRLSWALLKAILHIFIFTLVSCVYVSKKKKSSLFRLHIIKCEYLKSKQVMESKRSNLQISGYTELVYSLNSRNKCFLRTSDCLLIFISEAWVSLSEGLPWDSRGSMRVSCFKLGCTLCHVNSWDMITGRKSGEDSSPVLSGFLTGSHYRVGVHHDLDF